MNLQEYLTGCRVDDLRNIANNWCLYGVSHYRKQQLTDALNAAILDPGHFAGMLLQLNPDEIAALRNGRGRCLCEAVPDGEPVRFLYDCGLAAFQRDGTYFVPDDVRELFRRLDTAEMEEKVRRMTLIRRYISACVELYGVIPADQAAEIYRGQTGDALTGKDLLRIASAPNRRVDYAEVYEDCLANEALWAGNDEDEDEDGDVKELIRRQADKPYYIPPQEEFLKYADTIYFEHTDFYRALRQYIQRHSSLEGEKLEDACADIHLACQMEDDLSGILDEIYRHRIPLQSKKQVESLLPYLVNMLNSTRLWSNRGHTPAELHLEHPAAAGLMSEKAGDMPREVGRNDPCPCGSGKKYKKCCGMKA